MRLLTILYLILSACATRNQVSQVYSQELPERPRVSERTTILILVDGLSIPTFTRAQKNHLVPELERHFLANQTQIQKAHSIFPSLTFPNISGLLKEQPVNQTGFLGNSFIADGRLVEFESLRDRPRVSELMKGHTIFQRLNAKGFRTVSLDYGLGVDATISSELVDIKSGLAAEFQDYLYLDRKRIDSLKILLSGNQPKQWPEFVFIHLVGLDFISHAEGPQSKKAFEYLNLLDDSLKEIFELLRKAEAQNHRVVTMLTADHGFAPVIEKRLKLEEVVHSVHPDLKILNEGRMAALYATHSVSEEQVAQWRAQFLQEAGIEIAASRVGSTITLQSRKERVEITLQPTMCRNGLRAVSVNQEPAVCSDRLDARKSKLFYPFFLENVSAYFQSEKYPDLVLIPSRGVGFHNKEFGLHGGPTVEETVVPLLMRNASVPETQKIPALWQLLEFL